MGRRRKKRSHKSGLPPGTVVHVGDPKAHKVRITLLDYNEARVVEKDIHDPAELQPFLDSPSTTWINVDGVQNTALVESIGRAFGLHPLLQEDVCNTDQRPKMDDYGDCLYLDVKMLTYDERRGEVIPEQVSMVLGSRWVLSFQEEGREGDVFNPVRDRISSGKARIRTHGPDYLVYCLLDAIVDNYFVILEKVGDTIESLEVEMISAAKPATLHRVYQIKREMILLRRSVWPLREVISRLAKAESPLLRAETSLYFRDLYDHCVQVIDEVETFREMLGGMIELYLSSANNRMSEVMKVLTIMSTVFIPLTFIAGVYGMNFDVMPELKWRWGYFGVMVLMATVAAVEVVVFWRKGWIRGAVNPPAPADPPPGPARS